MNFSYKTILPHLIVIVGFIVVALAYFNPVLKGQQIYQSDIVQYTGMAKQQKDFRQATGEETYWTNSAFSGMPTYQLGAQYPHNYIKKLDHTLRFLPRPADYLFLYLMGFYILMLVLRVDFKLAIVGALAFGFSTYLIIILGVGHNAKAHAIAYMPLVLAGIILCFQKKYISGFLLSTIALGLELSANHFQMTYYLMLLVLIIGLVYLIEAIQKKMLSHFIKSVGILLIAVVLAIGLNATNIMATQEYVKESTRSKSELTINPDGSRKDVSGGLDKNYITEYSYGIAETFNLLIPRFMGGGSYEDVGKESKTYDAFRKLGATPVQALQEAKRAPTYWGDQPIVEAPAYIGAVTLFLFVMALFLVKGRLKRWVVAGSILALLLSYGKNFGLLTDLFIDYFPLYNKFRAVSSIQVLVELLVPILAIFGLSRLLNDYEQDEDKFKALKFSTLILGGLTLVFVLFKSSLFDFQGLNDDAYAQAYGSEFINAIKEDRMSLFTADAIRSLVLVLISAALIWFFLKKKLSENALIIAFGILILFDLIGVDQRYVNNDDFTSAIQVQKPFQMSAADREILKDTTYYRVLDMTSASTRASYYHNSLNGYHAAKLRRYNELYDFHIQRNNLQVLNMLNTKYIIGQDENGQVVPYTNPDANGHAWFIKELKIVETADEEIKMLDSLETKNEAVILDDFLQNRELKTSFVVDSTATIELRSYKPNYLKYESSNTSDGLVVFSEVFYDRGWKAYIDGELTDHFPVNYVLRAMAVPKGNHTIEFKFEPQVVKTGSSIALASSVIMALLLIGGLFLEFRKK